jgi:hypothetical protein
MDSLSSFGNRGRKQAADDQHDQGEEDRHDRESEHCAELVTHEHLPSVARLGPRDALI